MNMRTMLAAAGAVAALAFAQSASAATMITILSPMPITVPPSVQFTPGVTFTSVSGSTAETAL